MDVVGNVSSADLLELRQQCLSSGEGAKTNEAISQALAVEISNLKSLVGDQLSANDGFSESLSSARSSIDAAASNVFDLQSCIALLSQCTNEVSEHLKETSKELVDSQQQVDSLKSQIDALRVESLTDPLTGLGNRRFLREELQHAVVTKETRGVHFLVMIDLDNFKDVNDSFGHVVGDETLISIATELRRLSEEAAVGRYGGDEFCLLHAVEDPTEIQGFAERIRQSLADLSFTASTGDRVGPVTVSMGVARLRPEDTVQKWVARVDSLTYSAKASGKNFVMVERDLAAV
jgi:diguanylate cyclase